MTDLAQLELDLINAIGAAPSVAAIEEVRVAALGKSGQITELMKGMAALSVEEKKTRGAAINQAKQAIEAALSERRQQLAEKTRPLKRALEKTEQRMQALGAEQATIEQRLATALPPADIAEAGRRLKAVGDELATLEDEWLRLSGEIEAIE